jgi:hypothetical protein
MGEVRNKRYASSRYPLKSFMAATSCRTPTTKAETEKKNREGEGRRR